MRTITRLLYPSPIEVTIDTFSLLTAMSFDNTPTTKLVLITGTTGT